MLAGVAVLEQVGTVQRYSARGAEALGRLVADAIPKGCTSAYVVAPGDMLPPPPQVFDESRFDAAAYLLANPDVARDWTGTAWQHYDLFGRKEERRLDPAAASDYRTLLYFYNDTVPLGAEFAAIPVAKGISGWQPPGWRLFDVLSPHAPERLRAWVTLNRHDPAGTCLVCVALPPDSLPRTELRPD